MKSSLKILIRVFVLSVVYFICFAAVSGALLQSSNPQPSPDQAAAALAASGYQSVEFVGPELRDTPFALVRLETDLRHLLCLLRCRDGDVTD